MAEISAQNLQEYSKNDPIPEITRIKEKLLVIMMGTPGVGKSTFIKEFILPKNNTFKIVNPDDINKTVMGTDNVFTPSSTRMSEELLTNLIAGGKNIIYDVTGTASNRIMRVFETAKKSAYKIIFIHLVADLNTALRQNKERDRQVPDNLIKSYYRKSQEIMHAYDRIPHDGYYVVVTLNRKYKFMKYEHGKFLRRGNGGYR